jgi:plasmid stabilization system protein ParE
VARRLIWSPRARRNLRDILDFIAEDSPGNAETVARRFFARVESLPDQPGQGRRVPEYDGPVEFREVFVHSWRVIYRTNEREVRIVAIVHGARLLKNVPPL